MLKLSVPFVYLYLISNTILTLQEGQILFTVIESPVYGSLDLFRNESYHRAVNFTMEDIYENHLSYQHDGSETRHDMFRFIMNDGTNKVFSIQQDEPHVVPISDVQVNFFLIICQIYIIAISFLFCFF